MENENFYEAVRDQIVHYEQLIGTDYNIFKGDLLRSEVKQMLWTDPNAFLFGLISDQSVRAELAWSMPHNLLQRLGHFEMARIAQMDADELAQVIRTKPALHRYPSNIAKYLKAAAEMLCEKYEACAANIWKNATAAQIVSRLEAFKGISHKKAALGSLLLVRDLDIQIQDKENINLAYDIHIRRICLRTGFAEKDTLEEVWETGRKIFPDFPGRLTSSFWAMGRDICRPTNPDCGSCPLDHFCAHRIDLGEDIRA